ncbi:LPXTG cell wall anchor domain-containing protein [Plantactinospora sp. B6F1]|uniref:LPXTG cell wall anchor domain-containing protein n=1 Tax=Plantactinospora sp. B6F1 TaxID=3158971 RepID=UPI0032D91B7C
MRVPTWLRSLLAAPGAAVLLAGGLILGSASPAHADPPPITLTERCGVAVLSWDTGTIGGEETWATTVLRNGVAVDRFEMRERGNRRYGAADRDAFVVRRAGLPDVNLMFREPDGCADVPRLTVTAGAQCHVLELRLSNEGTTAVTGLRLYTPASPAAEELAPVPPGAVTLVRRLADGDNYALVGGAPGPEQVTWMVGTYREPAGCGPDAIAVEVADACAGVRVALSSRADGATRVTVLVDGVAAVHRVVPARANDTFTVPAGPGAVVVVRNPELGLDLATHTVRAVPCGSPTPDGSAGPGSGPGGGDDDAGAGGGLPVTGTPAVALLVAGGLLLASGTAVLLVARRRRIRFTGGD